MAYGRRSFLRIVNDWFEKGTETISASNNRPRNKVVSNLSKHVEKDKIIDRIELINPVTPHEVGKWLVISYCLTTILFTLYVPWKVVRYINGTMANISLGYSFIFSSPMPSIASIDYGLVIIEIVVSTAVVIILFLSRERLAMLINKYQIMKLIRHT